MRWKKPRKWMSNFRGQFKNAAFDFLIPIHPRAVIAVMGPPITAVLPTLCAPGTPVPAVVITTPFASSLITVVVVAPMSDLYDVAVGGHSRAFKRHGSGRFGGNECRADGKDRTNKNIHDLHHSAPHLMNRDCARLSESLLNPPFSHRSSRGAATSFNDPIAHIFSLQTIRI
jgi:hypothetical protein